MVKQSIQGAVVRLSSYASDQKEKIGLFHGSGFDFKCLWIRILKTKDKTISESYVRILNIQCEAQISFLNLLIIKKFKKL